MYLALTNGQIFNVFQKNVGATHLNRLKYIYNNFLWYTTYIIAKQWSKIYLWSICRWIASHLSTPELMAGVGLTSNSTGPFAAQLSSRSVLFCPVMDTCRSNIRSKVIFFERFGSPFSVFSVDSLVECWLEGFFQNKKKAIDLNGSEFISDNLQVASTGPLYPLNCCWPGANELGLLSKCCKGRKGSTCQIVYETRMLKSPFLALECFSVEYVRIFVTQVCFISDFYNFLCPRHQPQTENNWQFSYFE